MSGVILNRLNLKQIWRMMRLGSLRWLAMFIRQTMTCLNDRTEVDDLWLGFTGTPKTNDVGFFKGVGSSIGITHRAGVKITSSYLVTETMSAFEVL